MNPILTVSGISKAYGTAQALKDVSLNVFAGEVHAIVGENGAGKSTLVSILSGFVTPDSGVAEIDGQSVPFGNPVVARKLGIELVHQHFMLVPNFRVDENIALSGDLGLFTNLNLNESSQKAEIKAKEFGWEIDWRTPIVNLSVGTQQRVEILKALVEEARILILDEPTAVLSPDEVEDLMGVLRQLKRAGTAVVLIAHKLSEVMGIADRVTVLRNGKLVFSGLTKDTTADQIAAMMVGDRVSVPTRNEFLGKSKALSVSDLVVKGDRGERALRGLSFSIGKGEILGIGGVDGNGQVELAEAVAGVRRPISGLIDWVESEESTIGYIPQDRQTDGLALTMSVLDNLAIGGLNEPNLTWGPFIRRKRLRDWAKGLIDRFEIKTPTDNMAVRSLSGGNQQKVVVARVMSRNPDLLVAVNPTRGLDIRATDYVHEQILGAAKRGAAVLLISTDLDELEAIAHRILFLSRGIFVDKLVGVQS